MRINAYVLAADPAYLATSVSSYYSLVDRIVVSFDRDHVGWTGQPIPVSDCFKQLALVDPEGKLDYRPGSYCAPARHLLEADTAQRQDALDAASEGADWVVQLDGDEVMADPGVFADMLSRAAAASSGALDYPSRWIHGRAVDGQWLELSTRYWRSSASYPGPLAVVAGTRLKLARQADASLFRVDFRRRNTDPWHSPSVPVHAVISVDAAVLHFSWAREEEDLRAKARVSSHSNDFDWDDAIRRWKWRLHHPRLAVLSTPLRSRGGLGSNAWLRRTRLTIEPQRLLDLGV